MTIKFDIHDDNDEDNGMVFYDDDYFEMPAEYRDPEDTYNDRQLAAVLMDIKPQLSVVEINELLSEPSEWVSQINPMFKQRVVREIEDVVVGFSAICNKTRKSIFKAAENPEHTAHIQLAVFVQAYAAFSKFLAIKCRDHYTLEKFVFNYADASWWSEIWRDLVNKYGDKTPHFLI